MDEFLSVLAGLVAAALALVAPPPAPGWSGYVEAETLYIAAPAAGRIAQLAVAEGEDVAAGAVLFRLDRAAETAALRAAEARVAAAAAELRNLSSGGREAEIAAVRASLERARADEALATSTLRRSERLAAEGLAPTARLEQDEASLRRARAQVAQLEAELAVAELPARDPLQVAAAARLRAAEAEAEQARLRRNERLVRAPRAGRIERLFLGAGETAGAGQPVVALLPPGAVSIRFFVPQAERPALGIGTRLAVACDGCPAGLEAAVTRLAAEPEFTPPVIYSREERSRLSFLVEARLVAAGGLHPGQPVTVLRTP